jgi:hypothetical protein
VQLLVERVAYHQHHDGSRSLALYSTGAPLILTRLATDPAGDYDVLNEWGTVTRGIAATAALSGGVTITLTEAAATTLRLPQHPIDILVHASELATVQNAMTDFVAAQIEDERPAA